MQRIIDWRGPNLINTPDFFCHSEIAGIWDRTHADIERGTVNMRVETALKICGVFHVTPNEIFTEEETPLDMKQEELLEKLNSCTPHKKETALKILSAYLDSLYYKSCRELIFNPRPRKTLKNEHPRMINSSRSCRPDVHLR